MCVSCLEYLNFSQGVSCKRWRATKHYNLRKGGKV
nr:MAG TPA: hypothetical protein [Caudoviricetes sp.]